MKRGSLQIDFVLWMFLEVDILQAESERPLPLPPRIPSFTRDTERPPATRAARCPTP